jgi:DNA-binding MarR family transcriptional regulator
MARYDIYRTPGHLIRRAQQIVGSLFITQTQNQVTPIQYALLAMLAESDGLDQVTLARRVALDASTSGNTLERMAQKGWVERKVDPEDRRRRVLSLTQAGRAVFEDLIDDVETVQQLLLKPLDPKERVVFMRLLTKLVQENNEFSRVPLRMEEDEDRLDAD